MTPSTPPSFNAGRIHSRPAATKSSVISCRAALPTAPTGSGFVGVAAGGASAGLPFPPLAAFFRASALGGAGAAPSGVAASGGLLAALRFSYSLLRFFRATSGAAPSAAAAASRSSTTTIAVDIGAAAAGARAAARFTGAFGALGALPLAVGAGGGAAAGAAASGPPLATRRGRAAARLSGSAAASAGAQTVSIRSLTRERRDPRAP